MMNMYTATGTEVPLRGRNPATDPSTFEGILSAEPSTSSAPAKWLVPLPAKKEEEQPFKLVVEP